MLALLIFLWVLGFIGWIDPDRAYLWAKAVHVMAVIAWIAGMLYLPRLFVYHGDAASGSELAATLSVMEQRLLRIIMTPAMLLSWILGLWLAWRGFGFFGVWLHVKLAAVFALTGVHFYLASAMRQFVAGERPRSARHWRIMNEVPAVLMIVIVVMVIVKPF
jgi:putative membrane protein